MPEYWIRREGERFGPFTSDQVRRRAIPSDLISNGDGWTFLEDHPDFATSELSEVTHGGPWEFLTAASWIRWPIGLGASPTVNRR